MSNSRITHSPVLWLLVLNTTIAAFWLYLFWFNRSDTPHDFTGDAYRMYLPNLHYFMESLRHGTIPLWNPYEFAGMPFIATMEFGPYYPLTWLYFFFPLLDAHLISALVHFMLLGTFSYAYFRSSLKVNPPAALIGTWVILASCWSVNRSIIYMDEYRSMVYFPLVLLCVDRLMSRPERVWVLLLGFTLALQFLAGEVEVSVRTGIILIPYMLMRGIQLIQSGESWGVLIKRTCLVVIGGALSIGLTAMQWLPMYEVVSHSVRGIGSLTYEQVQFQGVGSTKKLLFTIISRSDMANYHYIGGLALLMALYAWRRVRWETLFYTAVFLVTFDLMRGLDSIIAPWYYNVPTGNWFRFPERYLPFAVFAVGSLSALGIQNIFKDTQETPEDSQKNIKIWFLPLLTLATWWVWDWYLPSIESSTFLILGIFLMLTSTALWMNIPSKLISTTTFTALLIGIVAIPIMRYPMHYVAIPQHVDLDGIPPGIETYLHENLAPGERVYTDYITSNRRMAPKAGLLWKIPLLNGFSPITPKTFWDYFEATAPQQRLANGQFMEYETDVGLWNGVQLSRGEKTLLDGFGVGYILLGPEEIFTEDSKIPSSVSKELDIEPFSLWHNPERLDRAFLLPPSVPNSLQDLVDAYQAGHTKAEIMQYETQSVSIRTQSKEASLLVLTDQYYPGWTATVDSKPYPIISVAGCFRGVQLPPGSHTVSFRYQPASLKWGLGISLLTWLITAVVVLTTALRKQQETTITISE